MLKWLPPVGFGAMVANHTRRKFVIGAGAIGLGTAGLVWQTESASAASIDAKSLDLPDYDHAGEIQEELVVTIETEITYESDLVPDEIILKGHAGEPEQLTELTSETISVDTESSNTVTETLEMDVLESMSLAVSNFELLTGMSQRTQDVQIKLEAILKESSQTLAEATTTETAEITVTENSAEIGFDATGEWDAS